MATPAWILVALGFALTGLPALAAEQTIGRQVQTWRPRALEPILPEAPPAPPGARGKEEPAVPDGRPVWEAWIGRILKGQPIIVFQPAWKGTWPHPQNPWEMAMAPGLRGDPTTGFGAEVVLSGAWEIVGLKLEGDTHLLWAETSGITSWRAAITRGAWSLEGRGWMDDALRPGELAATATFRQPF